MVFLALVPSPPYVAIRCRELLPRGFTLALRRFVFCYGVHKITPICAFHSRAPYPVRTFLTRRRDRSFYLYIKELFLIAELALQLVVLCVYFFYCLHEARSDVLATLVALH